MDELVKKFYSQDPIAGEHAKNELINLGQSCLPKVIEGFGSFSNYEGIRIRLGELFGRFPDASIDLLIDIFEKSHWDKMKCASYCFNELPKHPSASRLRPLLSSPNYDVRRCVIDSYGYLGTYGYEVMKSIDPDDKYEWGKLAHNILFALLRMAAKEREATDVPSRLSSIESFYELAGHEKFSQLLASNWVTLEEVVSDFKPVAADAFITKWLSHTDPIFQQLAVKALGWMRLSRSIKNIKNLALRSSSAETTRDCAEALSQMQTIEASNALVEIYQTTSPNNKYYKSICLSLATCLCPLKGEENIENIYPLFLQMGGEIAAHTYYALSTCGYNKEIWELAANSEDYVIRLSIAPGYARLKDNSSVRILNKMQLESSDSIEKAVILASLVNAGEKDKIEGVQKALIEISKRIMLRMIRYTWKREIVCALGVLPPAELRVWERLLRIDFNLASEEIGAPHSKGVEVSTNRSKGKLLNAFISYSKLDGENNTSINYLDEFKKHLAPLIQFDKLISTCDDTNLLAGENWNDTIKVKLNSSDIVFFLVSSNFLSTRYIVEEEIALALKRHEEKKCIIIPIIIRPSGFFDIDIFSKINAIPRKGFTIQTWKSNKKWNSIDDAWLHVYREVKKAIEEFRKQ